MSGPRLYDPSDDRYITSRSKIIDAIVDGAAGLLTFSERLKDKPRDISSWHRPPAATLRFLQAAADGNSRARWAL